jgi:hypothetical protein
MLRTASSLPLAGLLTLGFDPTRFQMKPPACYRATWQLPEPDSHRQATTSLRTANHLHRQPPVPLDARKIEASVDRRLWTKMRQVYRLLGLVRRHGPEAVEDACRRALDAEVIDVGLIERILTRGGGEQLPLMPKPSAHASRFVRESSDFSVRRPS